MVELSGLGAKKKIEINSNCNVKAKMFEFFFTK